MQVWGDFLVDDDDIRSCFGKVLDILLRVGDHQVRFQGEVSATAHRFDDQGAHSDVGDEVAIHDVDLDTLGTCRLDLAYLFA
jgi:hypothetical protein